MGNVQCEYDRDDYDRVACKIVTAMRKKVFKENRSLSTDFRKIKLGVLLTCDFLPSNYAPSNIEHQKLLIKHLSKYCNVINLENLDLYTENIFKDCNETDLLIWTMCNLFVGQASPTTIDGKTVVVDVWKTKDIYRTKVKLTNFVPRSYNCWKQLLDRYNELSPEICRATKMILYSATLHFNETDPCIEFIHVNESKEEGTVN